MARRVKRGAVSAIFMSNTRRRVALSADECDAHSGWRHVMVRYQRPGMAKKVKRRTNRRERRQARHEIRWGIA
jgi:hypothetical protein